MDDDDDDDKAMMRSVKTRKPRTMVARKYLCAAPHPSIWDEHAEALLKSLGGTSEKRAQVLKQTLETLEEMHPGVRKTGPGRKSNAEHAIAFYLYVMEFNDNTTIDFNEAQTDRKPNTKRRAVPESTTEDVKEEAKEEVNEPEGVKGEDDKAMKSGSSASSTMDSKEFLDQHNDQCEVCNLGGQLLCCSTCNLVFHLECVRPSLKELPQDNWSCAYCIASGVVGRSRDSKTRRKAKAAVLAMARLSPKKRKQATSGDESEDEDDIVDERNDPSSAGKSDDNKQVESVSEVDDDLNDQKEGTESCSSSEEENAGSISEDVASLSQEATAKETDEDKAENLPEQDIHEQSGSVASKESSEEQKSPGKRKLDLFKISDAFAPKLTPDSTRARRPRRQPTLFDPQSGAARKWQSDVSLNWKLKSQSEENKMDHEPNDATEEVQSMNKTEGERVDEEAKDEASSKKAAADDAIWCNFCKDDPTITICCFCACRVCFGKHDASNLLLCDNCDDEYHTSCLEPPLETVPTSRKWFCPSCDPSEEKGKPDNVAGGTRSSSKPPSSASKPPSPTPYGTRSTVIPKKTPPLPSSKEELVAEKVKEVPAVKIKRPVGRPRKTENVVIARPVQQLPRKRGRPPKTASPIAVEEEQKPRKRGRPPKSNKDKVEETPKPTRKRGRPPKSRSPLSSNRAATPSDTSSRPAKKQKVQDGSTSSQGVTPTRSVGKSSGTPRTATDYSRASGVKGFESRAQSQSGRGGIVSPITAHSIAGNAHLPSLPDTRFLESSPKLSPRLSTYPGGGHLSEQQENMLQTLSSNSSLNDAAGFAKTHRSRSGRTVKRSSFHDEIEEGEQHLKSQRYALEMQRRASSAATDPTASYYDEESWDQSFEAPEMAEENLKPAAISKCATTDPNLKSPPADAIDETNLPATEDSHNIMEARQPVAALPSESLMPADPLPNATVRTAAQAPMADTPGATLSTPFDVTNSQSSLGESAAAPSSIATSAAKAASTRVPRRKPGARECMQISRRFGARVIPEKYMDILQDYCTRGKVEHLIRMRERLDSHSRFLESQLAGLEALVKEKGELDVVVPPMPGSDKEDKLHPAASIDF